MLARKGVDKLTSSENDQQATFANLSVSSHLYIALIRSYFVQQGNALLMFYFSFTIFIIVAFFLFIIQFSCLYKVETWFAHYLMNSIDVVPLVTPIC